MTVRILIGDCREVLRTLADGSVQCCVTSPPYFGLRDYGHDGQIGLEQTPEAFVAELVAVFREVRRVLRDDGTLWLNLGDSYAANRSYQVSSTKGGPKHGSSQAAGGKGSAVPDGIKPKDLIGIPWRVAFALQQPYYAGKISSIQDRIWLAAMIDAEGCLFIHKRKAGTATGAGFTRADGTDISYARKTDTYGVGMEICNTSLNIIERIQQITGVGTVTTQSPEQNSRRKQLIYRWRAQPNECKRLVQEVYPHLIAKQQQARILLGCPSSGERAEAAHQALIGLHRGTLTDVDFPAPASLYEQGYYLRQDLIWAKSNPMPESVTDRCTKAHEYLFLLSKSARYYYDAKAIAEAGEWCGKQLGIVRGTKVRAEAMGRAPSGNERPGADATAPDLRNKRSVWEVATQPFSEAHFATFPPALIEPCILAGSRPGDTILDPFGGAGTTGLVADRLQRHAILVELNPQYAEMARRRICGDAPLFAEVDGA